MKRAPDAAPRQWCAYVRVSKVNGREGASFTSPQQQENAIKSAVDGRIAATFTDLDVTGTHMNREGLNAAMTWVRESPTSRGFAVMDTSRLARNLKGAFEVIDELTSVGAGFLSVHEQMDSTTPEGRLALQNMAAIHEFYSRNIGRRWKMVQSDRVDKGLPSGGPIRFGYQQAPGERLQTPHPENGQVLALMYRDFVAGQGAQKIAMSLNERVVKTGRGNAWGIQTVLRTLDSGFGAGLIQADGEHREGAHEAVITAEEWEQYRRVRDSRRMKAPRHKSPQWHLAGLAKCGLCGSNMVVSSYKDPKTLVVCGTYKNSRTCSGTWISKSKLDRAVFYWLGTRLDELARHADSAKAREQAYAKATLGVDKERATVEKLTREKIGTARLHAAGDLSAAEYRTIMAENEAEMKKAQAALADAQVSMDRLAPVDDIYETLIQWGQDKDAAEYNVLLGKVIDRVDVLKDQFVILPVVGKAHQVPRL